MSFCLNPILRFPQAHKLFGFELTLCLYIEYNPQGNIYRLDLKTVRSCCRKYFLSNGWLQV